MLVMDRWNSMDPLANKFYLLRDQRTPPLKKGKVTPWDPWPVDGYRRRDDPVLKAARKLLRARNNECIDNYVDRIILLPASGGSKSKLSGPCFQGGSEGMWLYSIRSPSTLPVRVILWQTPTRKILLRCGRQSQSLESFIASWARTAATNGPDGFCKHYRFWKSIKVTDEWLGTIPKHLHQRIHERWWMVNGFQFLKLPPELREIILAFAMGPIVEPFGRVYRKAPNPLTIPDNLTIPNLSLSLVNRQLHREITPVLYAHTTFFLRHTIQMDRFLFERAWAYERDKVHSRQWIRYLELHMNATHILSLFGLQIKRGDGGFDQYIRINAPAAPYSRSVLTKRLSIRRVRIRIPHVMESLRTTALPTICQKVFCLALWAGAREFLRLIPVVEFVGYVEETKKKEWTDEISLERTDLLPDPGELHEWQNQILTHWYVPIPFIGHIAILHSESNVNFHSFRADYLLAPSQHASAILCAGRRMCEKSIDQ